MRPSRGLFDTSFFIAGESSRPHDLSLVPIDGAISIITVGELRLGVLNARTTEIRDRRLATYVTALEFEPLPVDSAVSDAWARLRVALRESRTRMNVNDSWIAATALAHGIPVVTRDGDFVDGLGFDVVRI